MHRHTISNQSIQSIINNVSRARQYEDVPAEAFRSLGLLYLKSKNMPIAKTNLTQYLKLNPDASDREMIEYYFLH